MTKLRSYLSIFFLLFLSSCGALQKPDTVPLNRISASPTPFQPSARIEQTIDRIAQGTFHSDDPNAKRDQPKEFAIMESKLNLLGQKFSGAMRAWRPTITLPVCPRCVCLPCCWIKH